MARRFRFPLQTLLKLRRLREREAKRKVGAKLAELARLDQLDDATRQAIAGQQRVLLDSQCRAQLDPRELARGWAWIAHLRNTMSQRQVLRAQRLRELAVLQAEYLECRKQTKVIDKLRERRWEHYVRDRDRHAQAAADELAQQLHAKRADSGGVAVVPAAGNSVS